MDYVLMDSPLGNLTIAEEEGSLRHLSLGKAPEPEWRKVESLQCPVVEQLQEYFAGCRTEFNLELDPQGTPFQQEVWSALTRIPYGETSSYGRLAQELGRTGAARAVGAANGSNPIAIVIPCHRVIGASGKLTGYAYGLEAKSLLLELESSSAQLSLRC